MPVQFMERIPTVDYGYVELRADEFTEFVEGSASLHDKVDTDAEERGVKLLQNGGLVGSNPGLAGPAPEQAWQPANQQPPVCAHGPQKWVPPGVSKSPPYKPYQGFFACQGPRDQRCQRS